MSEFSDTTRGYMSAAGVSLRELARRTHYDPGGLSKVLTGRRLPSTDMAARLDEALDAGGQLAALAPRRPTVDEERLVYAARHPRRVDRATVDTLAAVLAQSRRLEDSLGSQPMLPGTLAHLSVIERLAADAHGQVRPYLIDVAAQWAEFTGWLYTSGQRPKDARYWFDRAAEWATESGNATLAGTVTSFKGHLAWIAGQVGPTIGLSQAAQMDRNVHVSQRAYDACQEARGHAMVGDSGTTLRKLDQASELAALAAQRGDMPPWIYYYTPALYTLEQGLALRILGNEHSSSNQRAIDCLSSGFDALDDQERASEWAADYIYQLALAYLQASAPDLAGKAAVDIADTARATGSTRLTRHVRLLRARLRSHWPSHPALIELSQRLNTN